MISDFINPTIKEFSEFLTEKVIKYFQNKKDKTKKKELRDVSKEEIDNIRNHLRKNKNWW